MQRQATGSAWPHRAGAPQAREAMGSPGAIQRGATWLTLGAWAWLQKDEAGPFRAPYAGEGPAWLSRRGAPVSAGAGLAQGAFLLVSGVYGPRCFLRNGLCCLRTPLRLGNRLSFLNDFLFSHLLNIDFPPPAPLIEQKPIRLCLLFSCVRGAGGGGRRRLRQALRLLRACASVPMALSSAAAVAPAAGGMAAPCPQVTNVGNTGTRWGAHVRPTELGLLGELLADVPARLPVLPAPFSLPAILFAAAHLLQSLL